MTAPVDPPQGPRVLVLSLGGTIFMAQDAEGLRAMPSDEAGHAMVTSRVDQVTVEHRALANVGSPSMRVALLSRALLEARAAVGSGAAGVVITHGTDTLEESAFVLDQWWDEQAPLVLTGAMRPATAPGADGPANLRDAVRTAASATARGLGVLVAMDGQAHAAARVTKVSTRSVDAFASEPGGPLGAVDETGLRLFGGAPARTAAREVPAALLNEGTEDGTEDGIEEGPALARVAVVALGLGDDGELLDAIDPGSWAGLVVIGSGVGHVPAPAVDRIRRLTRTGMPVVVATRVPSGGTANDHYDYPGSEVDLIAAGCVMAGRLRPAAARLLLQLLLAERARPDRTDVEAAFAPFQR